VACAAAWLPSERALAFYLFIFSLPFWAASSLTAHPARAPGRPLTPHTSHSAFDRRYQVRKRCESGFDLGVRCVRAGERSWRVERKGQESPFALFSLLSSRRVSNYLPSRPACRASPPRCRLPISVGVGPVMSSGEWAAGRAWRPGLLAWRRRGETRKKGRRSGGEQRWTSFSFQKTTVLLRLTCTRTSTGPSFFD
jgi:hypothetical protein